MNKILKVTVRNSPPFWPPTGVLISRPKREPPIRAARMFLSCKSVGKHTTKLGHSWVTTWRSAATRSPSLAKPQW